MEDVKAIQSTEQEQCEMSGKMGHLLFPNPDGFAGDLQLIISGKGDALYAECPLKQAERVSDKGACHHGTAVSRLCLKDTVYSAALCW